VNVFRADVVNADWITAVGSAAVLRPVVSSSHARTLKRPQGRAPGGSVKLRAVPTTITPRLGHRVAARIDGVLAELRLAAQEP